MGFYVKDLYVDAGSLRRSALADLFRDPLTNPTDVPETSPPIAFAALSPAVAKVTAQLRSADEVQADQLVRGIGALAASAFLPADDTVAPPSPITPIAVFADGLLDEADLVRARTVLRSALEQVDVAVGRLQPSVDELESARSALSVGA